MEGFRGADHFFKFSQIQSTFSIHNNYLAVHNSSTQQSLSSEKMHHFLSVDKFY